MENSKKRMWSQAMLTLLLPAVVICLCAQIAVFFSGEMNLIFLKQGLPILAAGIFCSLIIYKSEYRAGLKPRKGLHLRKEYFLLFLLAGLLGTLKYWIIALFPPLSLAIQNADLKGMIVSAVLMGPVEVLFFLAAGYYLSKSMAPQEEPENSPAKMILEEILVLVCFAGLILFYMWFSNFLITEKNWPVSLLYFQALLLYAVCALLLFRKMLLGLMKNKNRVKVNPGIMALGIAAIALAVAKYGLSLMVISGTKLFFPLNIIQNSPLWQTVYIFAGIYFILSSLESAESEEQA